MVASLLCRRYVVLVVLIVASASSCVKGRWARRVRTKCGRGASPSDDEGGDTKRLSRDTEPGCIHTHRVIDSACGSRLVSLRVKSYRPPDSV